MWFFFTWQMYTIPWGWTDSNHRTHCSGTFPNKTWKGDKRVPVRHESGYDMDTRFFIVTIKVLRYRGRSVNNLSTHLFYVNSCMLVWGISRSNGQRVKCLLVSVSSELVFHEKCHMKFKKRCRTTLVIDPSLPPGYKRKRDSKTNIKYRILRMYHVWKRSRASVIAPRASNIDLYFTDRRIVRTFHVALEFRIVLSGTARFPPLKTTR